MEEFKPVVFKVGEQKFGVDISLVQGIEKEQMIVPVPNAPKDIKGIINLRGEIVPVFSLKRKFCFDDVEAENPQYIIVFIGGHLMALEVDGVEEIHNVEEERLHKVPSILGTNETSYFKSVVSDGRNLIIIIDIEHLLTMEEMQSVDKIVKND